MEQTKLFFEKAYIKIKASLKNQTLFGYLLAAVLITIPLNFAFGSVACIIFLVAAFGSLRQIRPQGNVALLLPLALYALMLLSLFWTRDFNLSAAALQKELLFFFMPAAFIFLPRLTRPVLDLALRLFSYSMVFYAVFYFLRAFLRYNLTGNTEVFYFHELVTLDLNAIFVSVMASLAMFYFVVCKRTALHQAALFILVVFLFFLSSKSVLFIDMLLICWYYISFSKTTLSVKSLTVASVLVFLVLSFVLVPKIRARFLLEYETAFVDNTINKNLGSVHNKVYNVSLKQAWAKKSFNYNDFFPGTAIRVFQIRVFKEIMVEENKFLTGFGLDATQIKIKEKSKKYNVYPFYGELNFHNQYIQTFSELGLFGFLILIVMLGLNLKNAIFSKDFIHIVFAFSMIILFLTESFFCRQRGIVFFVTLYCLFNAVNTNFYKKEAI